MRAETRKMRAVVRVLSAGLTLCAFSTARGEYTLRIIAEPGDVIDGYTIDRFSHEYTNVAINNDGEVAFFAGATGPTGTGWSVMTQRRFIAGAGKVVDGTIPGFNSEDHQVDINSSGQVVYTALLPQGGRGLFVNEDLWFQPGDVIDGQTLTLVFRYPQINDAGTVVFDGRYAGEDEPIAIFTQTDILAHSGQTIDGYSLAATTYPRIGNAGHVAFLTGLLENGVGAVVSPERIVLKEGDFVDGMRVVRIDGLGGVTSSGEIVMSVTAGNSSDLQDYVVTQSRVIFRAGDRIADHRNGWLVGTEVVFNDRDELALLGAITDDEGNWLTNGLFAAGRLVAKEGDLLDGKVISEIYPNFAMNDLATVAFRVDFHDGTGAVVVATIPEPSTLGLVLGLVSVGTLILRSWTLSAR
jgi:hypothetical protein